MNPRFGRGEAVARAASSTPRPPPAVRARTLEIRILEALSDAAREMHRSLSLGDVVRVATERARSIVGAEEAATTQVTNGDWSSALTAVSLASDRQATLLRVPEPGRGGPESEVCRTNRPVRMAWSDRPRVAERSGDERPAPGAWLGAPLVGSDGRNLGLIQLAGKVGADEFSAGDEALLLQLARMASVAIENARLYETAIDTRSQLAMAAHVERVRAAELRAVINAMSEAVLVCDGSGRVDFLNPAAEALFEGRPVRTYEDLLSRFRLPDDRAVELVNGPIEVRLEDDPARWVELRVDPVPAVG